MRGIRCKMRMLNLKLRTKSIRFSRTLIRGMRYHIFLYMVRNFVCEPKGTLIASQCLLYLTNRLGFLP